MNLLHFVPRTYVRGYILVPLRGSRMTVLFHCGLGFLRSHTDSPVLGFSIAPLRGCLRAETPAAYTQPNTSSFYTTMEIVVRPYRWLSLPLMAVLPRSKCNWRPSE